MTEIAAQIKSIYLSTLNQLVNTFIAQWHEYSISLLAALTLPHSLHLPHAGIDVFKLGMCSAKKSRNWNMDAFGTLGSIGSV